MSTTLRRNQKSLCYKLQKKGDGLKLEEKKKNSETYKIILKFSKMNIPTFEIYRQIN